MNPTAWKSAAMGLVLGLAGFALGLLVAPGERGEARVLAVQFVNASGQDIRSIRILHGNDDTQEDILLLQLADGAHRTIGLNHRPGMGFNVEIVFADGSRLEYCANRGPYRDWFVRQEISGPL